MILFFKINFEYLNIMLDKHGCITEQWCLRECLELDVLCSPHHYRILLHAKSGVGCPLWVRSIYLYIYLSIYRSIDLSRWIHPSIIHLSLSFVPSVNLSISCSVSHSVIILWYCWLFYLSLNWLFFVSCSIYVLFFVLSVSLPIYCCIIIYFSLCIVQFVLSIVSSIFHLYKTMFVNTFLISKLLTLQVSFCLPVCLYLSVLPNHPAPQVSLPKKESVWRTGASSSSSNVSSRLRESSMDIWSGYAKQVWVWNT